MFPLLLRGSHKSSGHPHGRSDPPLTSDPSRVVLQVSSDPHAAFPPLDLYQPVLAHIDPDLRLFEVTEPTSPTSQTTPPAHSAHPGLDPAHPNYALSQPALAVLVFLRTPDASSQHLGEDGQRVRERLAQARDIFRYRPWKFHHSENLVQAKTQALPGACRDLFYTSRDLPLWGLRNVHYGREHVRYVLYTSETSWEDQVNFYRLIVGIEPDLLRDDFCLFTIYANEDYDIQFALKRVGDGVSVFKLEGVCIQIKVTDIGCLVPLFPNVCSPINDVRWQTTDHDGNNVVLNVVQSLFSKTSKGSVRAKHSVFKSNDLETSSGYSSRTSEESESCQNKLNKAFGRRDGRSHTSVLSSGSVGCVRIPELIDGIDLNTSCDDYELDQVSSSRVNSIQEEDEESLTLTNTSEESGIQMHNGSDDLSFCEDEPLKPCLHRIRASRIRAVKFRVRFKEQIEEFEDDSNSRLSSGIESEDQSDEEAEPSMTFNPAYSAFTLPRSRTTGGVIESDILTPSEYSNILVGDATFTPNTMNPVIKNQSREILQTSHHQNLDTSGHSFQQYSPNAFKTNFPPPSYIPNSNQTSSTNPEIINSTTLAGERQRPANPPPYQHRPASAPPTPVAPPTPTATPPGVPKGRAPPSYQSVRSKRLSSPFRPQSTPPDTIAADSQYPGDSLRPPRPQSSCSVLSQRVHSQRVSSQRVHSQHTPSQHAVSQHTPSHYDSPRRVPSQHDPEQHNPEQHTKGRETNCDHSVTSCQHSGVSPDSRDSLLSRDSSRDFPRSRDPPMSREPPLSRKSTESSESPQPPTRVSPLQFNLKFDTCATSGLQCREPQIGFYV